MILFVDRKFIFPKLAVCYDSAIDGWLAVMQMSKVFGAKNGQRMLAACGHINVDVILKILCLKLFSLSLPGYNTALHQNTDFLFSSFL